MNSPLSPRRFRTAIYTLSFFSISLSPRAYHCKLRECPGVGVAKGAAPAASASCVIESFFYLAEAAFTVKDQSCIAERIKLNTT